MRRIEGEFGDQRQRGRGEYAAQDEEHVAPAEPVAEHAARDLAEQLAGNLAGEEAAEHLLAVFVRNDVADIGHRDRDDAAGGEAAEQPVGDELRQRMRKPAQEHQQSRRSGSGRRNA